MRLFSNLSLGLLVALAVAGCKAGGEVTGAPSVNTPTALVLTPIVTGPGLSPYYSGANSITISGTCTAGATITMAGYVNQSQLCMASVFSFTAAASTDGVYTFVFTQSSSASVNSSPATFVWVRESSIAAPVITSPTPVAGVISSALNVLTISGTCQTGATISLSQSGTGSTVCANSVFAIPVTEGSDGTYPITLTQTDPAGNAASTSVTWKKYSITLSNPVSPVSATAGSTILLQISGGSGSYNCAWGSHASTATFTCSGGVYKFVAGTMAGLTDTLTISDAANDGSANFLATFNTVAGPADHLYLPVVAPPPMVNGVSQVGTPGQNLGSAARIQVVDVNGNGVAGTQLSFSNLIGDSMITTEPSIQTSDSNGYAQVYLKLGYTSVINQILVRPKTGSLPDAAASGYPVYVMTEESQSKNTGALGSTYTLANSPGAIATGDFNGDGYIDVAVLNQSSTSSNGAGVVSILLGSGNGMYKIGNSITLPNCSAPTSIVSGILRTASTKVDLVVACSRSSSLEVLLGNGNGTFATPSVGANSIISTANYETSPSAIAIGDLNNDGKLDLAIVSSNTQILGLRYGDGTGGFSSTPVTLPIDTGSSFVVLGDFDRNGYLDIAVSNPTDNGIKLFLNHSTATVPSFSAANDISTGTAPTAMVTGSFDATGYLELATLNTGDSTLSILNNDGAGNLNLTNSLNAGSNAAWLTTGDFNADGYTDIMVVALDTSNNLGSLIPLLGSGNNAFVNNGPIDVESSPQFIATADVNKDGIPDLLITGDSNNVLQVLPNQGGAKFGYYATVDASPIAGVAADFNSDGALDAAVISNSAKTITLLQAKTFGLAGRDLGFFSTIVTRLSVGGAPTGLKTADFNQDGKPDLVDVYNNMGAAGFLSVWVGAGDFTFTKASSDLSTSGTSVAGLVVADFNGDGYPDVAVVNQVGTGCSGNGNVAIFLNKADGTGALQAGSTICVGQTPVGITVSDFNKDHKLDLAVVNQGESTVAILLGNGNGTFQGFGLAYTTDSNPLALVAADLNADGIVDIVTANQSSISVLKGVGDGSLSNPTTIAVSSPSGIKLGDFNGDLRPDLLISSGTANSATVLFNAQNFTSAFSAQTLIQTNFPTNNMIMGDFNNDGFIDTLFLDDNGFVRTWMGH